MGASLRYGFTAIVRPFKGFWELKSMRGSTGAAWIFLLLAVLTNVFSQQYSGYFFSSYDPATFNVLTAVLSVLLPFALWVVVSWSVTTLMDGEGTLRDIFVSTSYALVPYILINIPLTLISNAMTLSESGYYFFFYGLSFVWSAFLLLTATMTIHQYSFGKTLGVIIVILFCIAVVLLVAIIFYDQVQKLVAFFVDSYRELSFRT